MQGGFESTTNGTDKVVLNEIVAILKMKPEVAFTDSSLV